MTCTVYYQQLPATLSGSRITITRDDVESIYRIVTNDGQADAILRSVEER